MVVVTGKLSAAVEIGPLEFATKELVVKVPTIVADSALTKYPGDLAIIRSNLVLFMIKSEYL